MTDLQPEQRVGTLEQINTLYQLGIKLACARTPNSQHAERVAAVDSVPHAARRERCIVCMVGKPGSIIYLQ